MGHHYIKRGIGGHHVLFCTISKHFCTETLKKKKRERIQVCMKVQYICYDSKALATHTVILPD